MAVKQGFSVGQIFQNVIDAKPEGLPWPVAILVTAVVLFVGVFPAAFMLWDTFVLRATGA